MPPPVTPDRQEVAEAEELLSSEAFAEDSIPTEELASFIPDEAAAEPTKAAADPALEAEAIPEAETPAPEKEEQAAPTPEAPAEKPEPEAPAAVESAAPAPEAPAKAEKPAIAPEAPADELKAETPAPEQAAEAESASHAAEKKPRSKAGKVLTSTLCILLETILLVAVALYGVMFLLARGPSGTASRLFVRSVRETSAVGFLANLYFSEEEIQALMSAPGEAEYVATDTNLISMTSVPEDSAQPDAWGFVDEDGDGIILDPVKGEGYSGYMMIVLDPSRVILGSNPSAYGGRGYTVEEFVQMYDAVAGINGGAFLDENGMGTGAYPDGLVIYEGQTYNWGVKQGFAGIDDKHILLVGCQSLEDAVAANIQYGASYGPMLVLNGGDPGQRSEPPHRHRPALRRRDPAAGHRRAAGDQPGRHLSGRGGDHAPLRRGQCHQPGRRLLQHDVLQRSLCEQFRLRGRHPSDSHLLHCAEGRPQLSAGLFPAPR